VQFTQKFDFSGLKFPTPLHSMATFETKNNVSINVYGYEKELYPVRITSLKTADAHVDLLLISNDVTNHDVAIKDICCLIRHMTKHHGTKHLFPYCLMHQNTEQSHKAHLEDCMVHRPQKIEMPSDNILKFNNFQKQLPCPVVVYADFESVINAATGEHSVCSYGFHVESRIPGLPFSSSPTMYVGMDAPAKFLEEMRQLSKHVSNFISMEVKPMNLTWL